MTPGRRQSPATPLERALAGEAAGPPVPTGFPGLDGLLGGGLRRGDLVVLAGDTRAGTSALALAMALRTTTAGGAATFASGEMTEARLLERAIAITGRVRVDDLRRGNLDDEAHAAAAAAALALRQRAPRFAALTGGLDEVAGLLGAHPAPDLFVLDPLQALVTSGRPLEEEVATAVRSLKALALAQDTALLATSSLASSPAARSDPRPRLADLGGLGAIRQHADVLLALFREEVYDPSPHVAGATELHVLKNRNGPLGHVDLYFYQQWMRFEDMVDGDG